MASGFNKDDFERLRREMSETYNLQQRITENLSSYSDYIKQVKDAYKDLKNATKAKAEAEAEITRLKKEQAKLDAAGVSVHSKEYKELLKQLGIHEKVVETLEDQIPILEAGARQMAEQVNLSNRLSATYGTINKQLKKGAKALWDQRYAMADTIGEIKKTAVGMNVLSKQAEGFRDGILNASKNTAMLGVGTKDLTRMQGSYSEQVGRTVMLTQDGLEAMAELAAGTSLGVEGAAAMAADMEQFGISVKGTRDLVENMVDSAHSMGLNSNKVISNLQKNLKLANKYHFKDGVQGITRMANEAARLRLDIDGIAGMADKVFRPEGAIEMAASLQVMGGEFAKMANPFDLMFKARNDFEGFAKEIGMATKEFTQFNEKTGEFDISGLMLDRMREISKISGISVDKLSEMGRAAKKLETVGAQLSPRFDRETQEYLATLAQFEDGQWIVNMGDGKKSIDQLNSLTKSQIEAQIKQQKDEKANLEKRAKDSQDFVKQWNNIKESFMAALLPVMNELDKSIAPIMKDLGKALQDKKLLDGIADFAKMAGKLAGGLIEWVAENPLKSLLGLGLFEVGKWILNGRMLGIGFNSVASAGGGSGPGGGGFLSGTRGALSKWGADRKGILGSMARSTGGKYGMGTMKGMGIGMGLGIGGMGLDMIRGGMDNQYSTGAQALGVGSSALKGAGMGMMFGPWGALIGGLLGAGYGLWDEHQKKEAMLAGMASGNVGTPKKYKDYIVQNGEISHIDPNDVNLGVKDGGVVDKMLGNGGGTPGNVNIEFKPLKIDFGTLTLEVKGGGSTEIDILDDPILMRDLSNVIQQELRKAIGGGKLNPNPIG
jgi:hypothetical protein